MLFVIVVCYFMVICYFIIICRCIVICYFIEELSGILLTKTVVVLGKPSGFWTTPNLIHVIEFLPE